MNSEMPKKRYGKKSRGTDKGDILKLRIGTNESLMLEDIIHNTGKTKSEIVRKALEIYSKTYQYIE